LTDFYSKNCERLADQYEKLSPETVNADWSPYKPATKSLILDVGSGSIRDAAWPAEMGHEIVTVETVDKLREKSEELHPPPSIQWNNDSLWRPHPLLRRTFRYPFGKGRP